jgi:hypothetical protein
MEYYSKGIAFVNGKRDLTFIRSIYPYSFLSLLLTKGFMFCFFLVVKEGLEE